MRAKLAFEKANHVKYGQVTSAITVMAVLDTPSAFCANPRISGHESGTHGTSVSASESRYISRMVKDDLKEGERATFYGSVSTAVFKVAKDKAGKGKDEKW